VDAQLGNGRRDWVDPTIWFQIYLDGVHAIKLHPNRFITVRKRVRVTDSPEFCGYAALYYQTSESLRTATILHSPPAAGIAVSPNPLA